MKYSKKPVVIEAIQFDGANGQDILDFIGDHEDIDGRSFVTGKNVFIPTLEGMMTASVGDYIIKGVNGEFYPCQPDIFAKTYERVEHEHQDLMSD
jgi:hypothetical protein